MSFAELVPIGLKASVVLTVVSIGLNASVRDATSLLRDPGRLIPSIAAMMLVVPLFALIVANAFELEPAVKIALAALSVSPVPPFWPKRSSQLAEDDSYVIGLLVATAVLSIAVIPLAVEVFESVLNIPLRMPASRIAGLAFATVLAPLFTGIGIRAFAPRAAAKARRPLTIAGTMLLVVSVVPVLFTLWPALTSLVGDGTLLTMLAFVCVGLIAGHLLGGPSEEEQSVLALASASRHPAIALAIAQVNFPNEKLIPAAIVLYLLVSAAAAGPYMWWAKRHLRHDRRLVALR